MKSTITFTHGETTCASVSGGASCRFLRFNHQTHSSYLCGAYPTTLNFRIEQDAIQRCTACMAEFPPTKEKQE